MRIIPRVMKEDEYLSPSHINEMKQVRYNSLPFNIFFTDINEEVIELFEKSHRLEEYLKGFVGMHTHNNRKYIAAIEGTELAEVFRNKNMKNNEISNKFKIIEPGFVEDEASVSVYYSASDILLLPSIAENFPLVILEAMSCGVPVVSFDVGGISEVVKQMESGYIARYKDSEDLANGVNLFLMNDSLNQTASCLCRKIITEKFTLDKQVEKYLKVYQEVINQR